MSHSYVKYLSRPNKKHFKPTSEKGNFNILNAQTSLEYNNNPSFKTE